MTEPETDEVKRVARAIFERAQETADADESETWFAEQFARAAIAAFRPSAPGGVEAMREALEKCVVFIEMLERDGKTLFAEGIHAGLRKGTDAPDSGAIWNVIARSNTSAWGDSIEWALDPFFSMWGGNEALKEAHAALSLQPQQDDKA